MRPFVSLAIAACYLFGANVVQAGDDTIVDFNRDVRPILSRNCFSCHGQDSSKRATKMRLDQRASATQALRKGGTPIVPAKPELSEMIRRITSIDEADKMPPADSGNHLKPEQIETLRRWIAQGAPYAEHWAFVKPRHAPIPHVKPGAWVRTPLDAFVLARLEKDGLSPSGEADRATLLRRLSLDLRGLPPTPDETRAFVSDPDPLAYEKAVDRYLHDPGYGERWARMWLDLARYADSAGFGSDPLRTIWRYRDWVIDAFNRNQPYDEFTRDQIAGDLLPNSTLDQRLATAFHRNTMTNTEGGTDREEFRVAAVKDRVDTTFQVWMGLTMGCAKCHSHKYDPLTQVEYYRFYAFFNQTADADRPTEEPIMPAPTREQEKALQRIDAQIASARQHMSANPVQLAAELFLRHTIVPPVEILKAQAEINRLVRARPAAATVPVLVELPRTQQRETKLMIKGNFLAPGDKVEPGVPAAFQPLPSSAPVDRRAIAAWLMHPDNPLTARVAVNRLWAQLFGVGLVETEEDFGTQGELPSHPELLDWLALEYQRLGWDTKAMLRQIVLSATYRQSSRITPERLARDPRNRLLSRAPRFRLEAEMVRDQALSLAGLLSRKSHGPSVYPPQPPGLWQAAFNGQRNWATSTGEDRYRRGLYTFWRRTVPYPSMTTFDAPSRETCTVRRIRTNTPLQTFVTLNDPVYVEAAQALARRIVREAASDLEARARFGLALCLGRPPQADQVRAIVHLAESEWEHYRQHSKDAIELATSQLGPLAPGQNPAELAAWTVVANVLLNLDGVLTRN